MYLRNSPTLPSVTSPKVSAATEVEMFMLRRCSMMALALPSRSLETMKAWSWRGSSVVPLPAALVAGLKTQLEGVRRLHESDLAEGRGEVVLPDALARKYPAAGREWKWQFVFPSGRLSVDPRSGLTRRHHLHEDSVQKAIRAGVLRAGGNARRLATVCDTIPSTGLCRV